MPYKYNQKVLFENWEPLKLDQVVSDDDYEKIPDEYKSSWQKTDSKPSHTISFSDGCVYRTMEIIKESTRQDDIKNWFAKKI